MIANCVSTLKIFGIYKIYLNSFRVQGGNAREQDRPNVKQIMQPQGSLFSLLIGRGREESLFPQTKQNKTHIHNNPKTSTA